MRRLLGFILMLVSSSSVYGNVHFELLDRDKYSTETSATIDSYFREVLKKLPQYLPTRDLKIKVRFKKLSGSALLMLQPGSYSVEMGYVSPLSSSNIIVLNEKILDLYGSPHYMNQKSRRHGTGRSLSIATLLHETAHIIDTEASFSKELSAEISTCNNPRKSENYRPQYFASCSDASSAQGKISHHPDFVRLTQWKNLQRTSDHPGSPNSYEYTNLSEYFAINFEYFLLDEQFKCRRPTLYKVFQQIFKYAPFADSVCPLRAKLFFSSSARTIDITPAKVMNISYLHAGPGKATMSRWGHSMFKLTLCNKDLENSRCEGIVSEAIIAFQAYIDAPMINSLVGLTGGYPSRLFVLDPKKVIEDYNRKEFRDVQSFRLRLTPSQKDLFVNRILEISWAYSGKYYFLTNNCATEAMSLIQSILPSGHPLQKTVISSPIGLLEALQATRVIEVTPDKIFPSFKESLQTAIETLRYRTSTGDFLPVESYLQMKASERYQLFARKSNPGVKERASYQILERYVLYVKSAEFDSLKASAAYEENPDLKSLLQAPAIIKENAGYTYGIAFDSETITTEEYQQIWSEISGRYSMVVTSSKEEFPELKAELEEIRRHL